MLLCLEEETPNGHHRNQRKNSASRLLNTCQKYLNRRSSESSVSPQRSHKSSWYDGDVETGSDTGPGDRGDTSPGHNNATGARAKIREITRSLGKKKGGHKVPRPKLSDVVGEASIMGNTNVSGATAEDPVTTLPPPHDPLSSPTCYQTADNADTSASDTAGQARQKRVHLLIDTWEARSRDDLGACLLSAGSDDKSTSRSSMLSTSQSSSDTGSTSQTTGASSVAMSASGGDQGHKKLYHSAREMMTSEKTFVNVLTLLNVDFRNFVEERIRDTGANIIPLQDFQQIFRTLPQLLMFNKELLLDFEDRIENWDSKQKIADVIVRKGPFLKLYTNYVKDFPLLTDHFEKCLRNYPEFRQVVSEFESQSVCQNLKITHYMLKPVQRLPQYKLMLEEYLKHLPQDSADFDDTTEALKIVAEAAQHADDALEKGVR